MIYHMRNTIQPYAWGSRTAFTELFGFENPDNHPMAELWMGAHPKAPSMLEIGGRQVSLVDHIAGDPVAALGRQTAELYKNRFPFLFKVLAAADPLSIQAHPALRQARAGFADEEKRGIPRDAPHRNYRDDNHKPELICAITEFWGMRGFRQVEEIRADFEEFEFARFIGTDTSPRRRGAVVPPTSVDEIASFFRSLMETDAETRAGLVGGAVRLARRRWESFGDEPLSHSDPLSRAGAALPDLSDPNARFFWVLQLSRFYPTDIGVLSPLYLNLFALEPGEATFQPAGVLHAYLHGTGMEIMANSDNVLRGGLTPKHVDVDELLSVGVFRPEPGVVLRGKQASRNSNTLGTTNTSGATNAPGTTDTLLCHEFIYDAPFAEFCLSHLDLSGGQCGVAAASAPQILFCDRGSVQVRCGDGGDAVALNLSRGESAFVDAVAGPLIVSGSGSLFRATTGEGSP